MVFSFLRFELFRLFQRFELNQEQDSGPLLRHEVLSLTNPIGLSALRPVQQLSGRASWMASGGVNGRSPNRSCHNRLPPTSGLPILGSRLWHSLLLITGSYI